VHGPEVDCAATAEACPAVTAVSAAVAKAAMRRWRAFM